MYNIHARIFVSSMLLEKIVYRHITVSRICIRVFVQRRCLLAPQGCPHPREPRAWASMITCAGCEPTVLAHIYCQPVISNVPRMYNVDIYGELGWIGLGQPRPGSGPTSLYPRLKVKMYALLQDFC